MDQHGQRTWRRYCCAEAGIFLGIWLTLIVVGRSAMFRDPGTYWHTVVGQRILATGEVPRADWLSFTRDGQSWVAHQWLAECLMASVHRVAGFDGLLLLVSAALAAVYTWVGFRWLRAGFHLLAVGAVLAVALLASSHQFHVRPLIVTLAMTGVTFAMLLDVDAGRIAPRRLGWLVLMFVLWANLHGGVLAGIAMLGLCVAWWLAAWAIGLPGPVRRRTDAIALVAVVAGCCLAVLVNPYGLDLPRAWLTTLAIPLPELIQEHAPVDLTDPLGWTVIALGAGYIVALAGLPPRRPKITWLVPLLLFVLACQRVRNIPLFGVPTALALAEVLPHTRWVGWLKRRELFFPPDEAPPRRCPAWSMLPPAAAVLIVAAIQIAGVTAPVVGRGWVRFHAVCSPNELLPELRQINDRSPQQSAIFNDMAFGGFLIYHAPRLRVFIDDRCALYGTERLTSYDQARRGRPEQIDAWQQEYGFRHALVETHGSFDRYLDNSADWHLVQRTPTATLYRLEASVQHDGHPGG